MSNNKKFSSVEWLVEELRKYIAEPWKYAPKGGKEAIVEQAKAMHKEEIMQSLNDGKAMALANKKNQSLEKYYNETFNNNED